MEIKNIHVAEPYYLLTVFKNIFYNKYIFHSNAYPSFIKIFYLFSKSGLVQFSL